MVRYKKTFIFYNDRKDYVDQMTREEAGMFLKAILSYQNGDPPDLEGGIKFIRGRIKKQLDEDNKKRAEEVEKRRKAGRKGGLARVSNAKQNQASAGNSKQVLEKNKKFKQVQADNDNVNDNENVKKTKTKKKSVSVGFDNFWREYPKRVGKKKAYESYLKAIKENTAPDDIMQGLQNYLQHIAEKGVGDRYIKHPATWLNQGCWEDDYNIQIKKIPKKNETIKYLDLLDEND